MLRVEKFQMSHLEGFDCQSVVADLKMSMLENHLDSKRDMISIINEEGNVICFAGVNHLRLGVGEGWILRSRKIEQHKFEFFKIIKGLVNWLFEYMGLHRLEIAIDCSWKEGHKWATSLGLNFESITRSYDFQMRDHAIYTRVGKWQKAQQ